MKHDPETTSLYKVAQSSGARTSLQDVSIFYPLFLEKESHSFNNNVVWREITTLLGALAYGLESEKSILRIDFYLACRMVLT